VSDFVSRMAARLVGDAVVAQPRLRGLFEADDPAAALEVVDEEVVARSSREAAAAVLPSAVPANAPPAASPGSEMPSPPSVAASRVEALPAAAPPEHVRPPATATAVPQADPRPAPPPVADSDQEPAPPHVTVFAVPASPLLPALVPAPEAAAPTPELSEPEELQPVRVHIGRLEVRASLEEQARPRRAPEERPTAGLSLADYLRGERETA
jgi:hypothetical protein